MNRTFRLHRMIAVTMFQTTQKRQFIKTEMVMYFSIIENHHMHCQNVMVFPLHNYRQYHRELGEVLLELANNNTRVLPGIASTTAHLASSFDFIATTSITFIIVKKGFFYQSYSMSIQWCVWWGIKTNSFFLLSSEILRSPPLIENLPNPFFLKFFASRQVC